MRVCIGWRQFLLFLPLFFFVPHFLSVLELHKNINVKDHAKSKPRNLIIWFLDPLLVQVCRIVCNAKLTMPQSNTIIITDPASRLPLQRNKVALYPIQDSDVAVIDDLGKIFRNHKDFDLALTFRNNKEQPLNLGFIAVRGTRDGILRAKVFLEEVLVVYGSKYMKASRMLGDQLALASVIKSYATFDVKKFSKHDAFEEKIGRALVLFLPYAIYNWTPPEGAGQFHGMPLDVKVVHFKGSRKRLMLESWKFLNSSSLRDISNMLCLILGSGRTKYDF